MHASDFVKSVALVSLWFEVGTSSFLTERHSLDTTGKPHNVFKSQGRLSEWKVWHKNLQKSINLSRVH